MFSILSRIFYHIFCKKTKDHSNTQQFMLHDKMKDTVYILNSKCAGTELQFPGHEFEL